MKKRNGLNTQGIIMSIVLAVIMFVHHFRKLSKLTFINRLLESLLRTAGIYICAGILLLALLFAMIAAIKITDEIYDGEDEDDLYKAYMKLEKPTSIICYIASYIVIFFFT